MHLNQIRSAVPDLSLLSSGNRPHTHRLDTRVISAVEDKRSQDQERAVMIVVYVVSSLSGRSGSERNKTSG